MVKKLRKTTGEKRPGIAFEKLVSALQARFDPATTVEHNVVLTDRIGQARQFDVVIRGVFAGQSLLGVIECKDLNRPIGTPEVDAFQTKSSDANANFRILISRKGFSRPAIDKCKHYGIQTLSLLQSDATNQNFRIGNHWYAEVSSFAQLRMTLSWENSNETINEFEVDKVKLGSKPILDWYTNYLSSNDARFSAPGWTAILQAVFNSPTTLEVAPGIFNKVLAVTFAAERVIKQLEYFVGISGDAFYDWQKKEIRFPANAEIISDAVPMDFSKWQPRQARDEAVNNWVSVSLKAGTPLTFNNDAIDLTAYGNIVEASESEQAA